MRLLELIFWASALVVNYSYAGYPLLLLALSALRKPSVPPPEPQARTDWPQVTVLVAAHNEERDIAARVRNLLDQDYPAERLRVLVGSDGSSDATVDIVRTLQEQGAERVQLQAFTQRRGKASVLNDLVALASPETEILVFTDANTSFAPDALRQLLCHFSVPEVACVCGELRLMGSGGDNQDHIYWRYERMLKRHESRLGALLGANGGVYALRRSAYRAIPANTIVDDFWIAMQVYEAGQRCVYEREALAFEATPERVGEEFRRRVRIGMGNYQALTRFAGLLHPRHGALALALLSHKVLRWLAPQAMLLALASNALLAAEPFYALLLLAQLLFYAAAALGWVMSRHGTAPRALRLPLFFVSMNLALLLGCWHYLRGGASGIWARSARG